MPRPLPVRGVVEGFYGPPWTPDARLGLIEFIAERAMNAYVYAPKSDPKHRDRWREPYDEHEAGHFHRLAERAASGGVRFGFAISPGLDIDYTHAGDRDTLLTKLVPLLDVGVDWFVLALDDIPPRPGLAVDQAGLASWLLDALRSRAVGARLTLVPTEYVGVRPTPYLRELAERLPAEIEDVMWTGATVCSPTIDAGQARSWADALGGRHPLLWDNYPVNDGTMERALHLGPYRGRPPELSDELAGVLCNPMLQPYASRVALATAADYLADPARYDPAESWARAITEVGGTHAAPLGAIAAACEDGPLHAPEELQAHRIVTAIAAGTDGGDDAALAAARDHFTAVKQAAKAWADAPDDPLGCELEPWLRQGRAEAAAALAAVGLLEHLASAEPETDASLLHVFAVVFAWNAARAGDRTVFGPRFAVYPAVVQLADGSAGLDVGLAVSENRNAVDRLCRLALDAYRRRTERPRAGGLR